MVPSGEARSVLCDFENDVGRREGRGAGGHRDVFHSKERMSRDWKRTKGDGVETGGVEREQWRETAKRDDGETRGETWSEKQWKKAARKGGRDETGRHGTGWIRGRGVAPGCELSLPVAICHSRSPAEGEGDRTVERKRVVRTWMCPSPPPLRFNWSPRIPRVAVRWDVEVCCSEGDENRKKGDVSKDSSRLVH